MKIAIIGAGAIGSTLAQRLAGAGHDVTIANSRAPETVDAAALSTGARPAWATDVTTDADIVIVSVNLGQVPVVAPLVHAAPPGALVIDTSNYYPERDGDLEGLEDGQVESLWVQEHYGRPVAKAWNSIIAASFADNSTDGSVPGRIALPVSADDTSHREITMALVEATGFDAVDAGDIASSWRQQPGTPAYCTDLTTSELRAALDRADARHAPRRRDLVWDVISDRAAAGDTVSGDYVIALNRAVY